MWYVEESMEFSMNLYFGFEILFRSVIIKGSREKRSLWGEDKGLGYVFYIVVLKWEILICLYCDGNDLV